MNTSTPSLLVIDDDPEFCAWVTTFLAEQGFDIREAHNAYEARAAAEDRPVDIYLLDLLLPGTSGKVLCREIVETTNAGIIVVSVLESDEERIALLELGADDYLVKPFNPRELLARIRAYLRRNSGQAVETARAFGPWCLSPGERKLVRNDSTVVTLTPSEARVMRLFAENPKLVFERDEILAVSRMRQLGERNDRSVDNLIKRLRRKIEADPSNPEMIETVWGKGYAFRPLPPEA